jgi:23S rRNA (cytosine1962-C5)-methyltransferase
MHVIINEICRHLPVGQESRRLFHGRGHCFPGFEDLLVDWYQPHLLISLYALRDAGWLQELANQLKQELPDIQSILLQERYLTNAPLRMLSGERPEVVYAVESGLRFQLRLHQAQNIGFFLDMARGRELVKQLADGKRILNLFAYSCSFSVAALSAGAEQVVNLDMNKGALELGRLNHQLNKLDLRKVSFLPLEFFRSISKLKRLAPFELIVCDPPAYQGKNFKAERDWPKLLRKLPGLLAPGGEIVACLNGPHLPPEFLQQQFKDLWPEMGLVKKFSPGDHFPEANCARGTWTFHYQDGLG